MKRTLLLTLLVSLVAATALADLEGAWTAQADDKKDRIYFNTTRHPFGNWGMSHDLSDFTGLTRAQIDAAATTPVQFVMRRDAGTITFDGTFRKGFGAGQLTFTPNRSYFSSIRSLGIRYEPQKSEEEDLFRYAMTDVSIGYAREMHAIYPDSDLRDLYRLRAVNVTPAWLREMRGAGVEIRSAQEAKKLAGTGVTAKFVRELADAGYKNLSVRDLTRLAAAGVDGKFIRDMQQYREK
jgi:hypothetical protein